MKYLIPSWKALRVLGESNTVKLTILTPIMGYMIIFSEKFQEWFTLASSVLGVDSTQAAEATISNSYFLYFGLISIALASGLYSLSAPSLAKEYHSNREYLQENIEHITPSRLLGLSSFVEKQYGGTKERHDVFVNISQFESSSKSTESIDESTLRTLTIDLHNHFWNCTVYSRDMLRALISLLYISGFILLMIPTVKLLWNVVF
ncbi:MULTISPECIES: hypothetical protein [unclassified Vibrio]|uniref:hypothetical protein n=1 Tax=unclassified Vibrio TaxID=2614977 RepID=UPI000B8E86C1|nr:MULTISPECIES: hypothetical protein [unclassified Vibrio]NAX43109.1 hypothetical protein [Vibrio sp. V25_P4S6T154]OXX41081.1 hypothetical protein B9J93_20705 [Vibrio sp. V17_P4S1T151]OXX61334.1 hypothetical protein B9J89_14400 [Vibrio sp. V15_P4S5T153]